MGVQYETQDAELGSDHFTAASFDMVTSCVALRDMPKPERAIAGAYKVLRPGGRFVFSITHPCTDVPLREWEKNADGRRRALKIGRYFEGARIGFTWRGSRFPYKFATSSLHRMLSWWINVVIGAGFRLHRREEPRPSDEAVTKRPDLSDATIVPYFLLIEAQKP